MTILFDSGQHGVLLERLRSATIAIQDELDTLDTEVAKVRNRWDGVAL